MTFDPNSNIESLEDLFTGEDKGARGTLTVEVVRNGNGKHVGRSGVRDEKLAIVVTDGRGLRISSPIDMFPVGNVGEYDRRVEQVLGTARDFCEDLRKVGYAVVAPEGTRQLKRYEV